MAYDVKVIADSTTDHGVRLTTVECTYPRFIHSEVMTHRMFSRNTASSRAIPYKTMRQRVLDDPVLPVWWGKNEPGMQANEELEGYDLTVSKANWLHARNFVVQHADKLNEMGLHKQIINRLLEPWLWHTAIITATEWNNFFNLRCHRDAQPEFQRLAYMIRDAYFNHEPTYLRPGEWHLPYIHQEDRSLASINAFDVNAFVTPLNDQGMADLYSETLCKVSAARCARVSYLTHDGRRDHIKDLELFDRLTGPGHWSPLEHPAQACEAPERWGNFIGWKQFRKCFPLENRTTYDSNDIPFTDEGTLMN